MTQITLLKKTLPLGWLAYTFRASVHYHQDGDQGSMQGNAVLELRALYFDSEATGSQLIVTLSEAREKRTSKSASTVTHFFQQIHTY